VLLHHLDVAIPARRSACAWHQLNPSAAASVVSASAQKYA
jgi:hypothetical protein